MHNKDKGDPENSPNIDTKNQEIEKETTGQELVSMETYFASILRLNFLHGD